MPPRRTPEEITQASLAQMAQAVTGMTNVMMQQANQSAAREAAAAARQAVEDERQAQRLAREVAQDQARGHKDFRSHDPPKFWGETDPEKADLWIQEVEKIFAVLQTPAESKVGLASYLLSGDAEHWWVGARAILTANQEEVTWVSFCRVFLERYFPVSAQEEKELQFLDLQQGSMSVAEFAAKLESLAKHFRFFRNGVDERYLCTRFMGGLNYEIEESVRPLGIQQFQPLVEKCRQIEVMKNKRKGNRPASGGPVRSSHESRGKQPPNKPYHQDKKWGEGETAEQGAPQARAPRISEAAKEGVCFRCGKPGHYANQCGIEKTCYNCNRPGHLARDCWAPKAEPG